MPNGSLSLAEYSGAMMRLACSKCGRSGQLRKAILIEKYGRERPLPELLRHVAGDCPKMLERWQRPLRGALPGFGLTRSGH